MICKKCDEEITYLNYTETVAHYGTYEIKEGISTYTSDGDSRDNGDTSIIFFTPCCNEDVAESQEEAIEFLQRKEDI